MKDKLDPSTFKFKVSDIGLDAGVCFIVTYIGHDGDGSNNSDWYANVRVLALTSDSVYNDDRSLRPGRRFVFYNTSTWWEHSDVLA
jgi:hypothetical protein